MGFIKQLFGGKSSRQKRLDKLADTNTDFMMASQRKAVEGASKQALSDTGMSREGLGELDSFFNRLFSGDRSTAAAQYQPEISDSVERYQKAYSDNAEFSGRGGRAPTFFGQLASAHAGDLNNVLYGAKKDAADQLLQIHSFLAQLGLGFQNSATGTAGNTLNNLLGIRQQNEAEYARRSGQIGGVFGTVGRLIGGLAGM